MRLQQQQRKLLEAKEAATSKPSAKRQTIPVSPALGKLSISEAIGLITIRLSKLEEFMIRTDGATGIISDNNTLLRSLVSRISSLESSVESFKGAAPESENGSSVYVGDSEEVDDPLSWENTRPQVIEDMNTFKTDLDDIRKLVIKIQTNLG